MYITYILYSNGEITMMLDFRGIYVRPCTDWWESNERTTSRAQVPPTTCTTQVPPSMQKDYEHATSVLYCTSVAHSLDLCDQQLCTWHVSSCFDHTNWGSSLYKDGTRDAKVYFNIKVKNKVWWSKQPKKCISYTLEMPTSIERKYQIPNSRQLQCRKGVRP